MRIKEKNQIGEEDRSRNVQTAKREKKELEGKAKEFIGSERKVM